MRGIERRLERLEGLLGGGQEEKRLETEERRRQVAALFAVPFTPSPPDPDELTPEAIAASPFLRDFVRAFGQPAWKDGAWYWPEHGDPDWDNGESRQAVRPGSCFRE